LILNDTPIVSDGVYQEAETMDLPSRFAQLHKAGVQVIFSVGAGGTQDFSNIGTLLEGGVPGPGNALYDNFKALEDAMVSGGGDIDAIDFDNEDDIQTSIMVNFGSMLANIGYASVTLCPYNNLSVWTEFLNSENSLTVLNSSANGWMSEEAQNHLHMQDYIVQFGQQIAIAND
jgi:hypothetical protein